MYFFPFLAGYLESFFSMSTISQTTSPPVQSLPTQTPAPKVESAATPPARVLAWSVAAQQARFTPKPKTKNPFLRPL